MKHKPLTADTRWIHARIAVCDVLNGRTPDHWVAHCTPEEVRSIARSTLSAAEFTEVERRYATGHHKAHSSSGA